MVGDATQFVRRHPHVTAVVAVMLVVTLPFVEIVVGHNSGIWGDVGAAHIPRYVGAWQNVRNGDSPFWWSTVFSGFNALGGGQAGVFYLPNAVFGWLNPVPAFRWWFLFHLWATSAGWYAWSWRRWRSIPGAATSAIGAVLTGYSIYHSMFMPYVAALAFVPWILLSLDLIRDTGAVRYSAALALVLAPVALLGLPQFLWLTLIAVGVISTFELSRRKMDWRAVALTASGIVLGVGLGAVQLLPQARFSSSSVRPSLDRAAAFEYSVEWRHLWTAIAPSIMGGTNSGPFWESPWLGGSLQHEVSNYLGITFLGLAVLGALHLGRNRLSYAMVTLALLGLFSSLGGRTPVGSLVYRLIPFADHFRVWGRNQLWLTLAVIMLSGAGVRALTRDPMRAATRLAAGALGLLVLMLVLPSVSDLGGALVPGREGAAARLMPSVLLILLAAGVSTMKQRRRVGLVLVTACCALDGTLFAISGPTRGQSMDSSEIRSIYESPVPSFGAIADQPGGLDRWVSDTADASTLWPDVLGSAAPTVNGYDPLLQADYSLTVGDMAYNGYLRTSRFWTGGWYPDVLRVTTLLASPYAEQPSSSWTYRGQASDGQALWDYTPRLAETYLVGAVRIGNLDDARLALANPNTPLTELAYVDAITVDPDNVAAFANLNTPGPSGTINNGRMDDGGHGQWTVTADRPSILITSYAWMEGWTATVDGTPVPVARTNGLVLGIPVPAGQHEIRLAFTPPGWTTGRNISITALIIVILMLATPTPWGQRTITATQQLTRRTKRNNTPATGATS